MKHTYKNTNTMVVFKATLLMIVIGLLLGGCVTTNTGKYADMPATVFKSPSCGCCVGHAAELEKGGFDVDTVELSDISEIKEKHSIPRNMESCHTTEIEGYFVEGHVPLEAIDKLLSEQPDIDGISLPYMPAGSPGMPGTKQGPWTIYALKDGQASDFMVI